MKAQSKVYIQLQSIYKTKARKDAAEVLAMVEATPGGEHVDPAEVDLFCKNAAFVKLINATGGGTHGKISRADRLKSAAGKQSESPNLLGPGGLRTPDAGYARKCEIVKERSELTAISPQPASSQTTNPPL